MAITDDLYIRMQAQAGQSNPTNEAALGDSEVLSGGTIALVDSNGEKAWNFAGSASSTAALTTSFTTAVTTDGGGCTIACRFYYNTLPTGSYDELFGVSTDTTLNNGITVTKSNTTYRGRYQSSNLPDITGGTLSATTMYTLVLRLNCFNASNTDTLEMWYDADTGSRVSDYGPGTSGNAGSAVLDTWCIDGGVNSADVDIFDFMFWHRELTDAECSAVADDIRSELPAGGASSIIPQAMHHYRNNSGSGL